MMLVHLVLVHLIQISYGFKEPTFLELYQKKPVADYKRVCIYPNWAALRSSKLAQLLPENIDPNVCTHIHYVYADIDLRTLKLIPSQSEDTNSGKHGKVGPLYGRIMQLKKVNPSLKILISIGGWLVKSTPFIRVMRDKEHLKIFIKNVLEFLQHWKFDGLDIQWEYPGAIEIGATTNSKTRYMLLVKHLYKAFDGKYLLTTFAPADETHIEKGYQVDFICNYLDYVSVETYDFSKNLKTGHNSQLYSQTEVSVDKSINFWINRGCDKKKLLVGLPTYAKGILVDKNAGIPLLGFKGDVYIETSKYTKEEGILSYYEVCETLRNKKTKTNWDNMAKMSYLVTEHKPNKNRNLWISYEDVKSAKEKAYYVKQKKLGGISIWSIDLDDFTGKFCLKGKYPIARAIKEVLNMNEKKPEPSPKIKINYETDMLTTKITQYIRVPEPNVKRFNNFKMNFSYKLNSKKVVYPLASSINMTIENTLAEKPLSYFQSLYKKYKSLGNFQIVSCLDKTRCYYYLKLKNSSSSLSTLLPKYLQIILSLFLLDFVDVFV